MFDHIVKHGGAIGTAGLESVGGTRKTRQAWIGRARLVCSSSRDGGEGGVAHGGEAESAR